VSHRGESDTRRDRRGRVRRLSAKLVEECLQDLDRRCHGIFQRKMRPGRDRAKAFAGCTKRL
jgi:hypothetical protein